MQSYFKEQTGHNPEVYVNNIVVKSRQSNSLIADLEEPSLTSGASTSG
jgi:hypothetical protein